MRQAEVQTDNPEKREARLQSTQGTLEENCWKFQNKAY